MALDPGEAPTGKSAQGQQQFDANTVIWANQRAKPAPGPVQAKTEG